MPSARALTPADMICHAVYAANHALGRTYRTLLDPLGLTYPQYLVMVVLWAADEPRRVKSIGDELDLDSGTLTPLLKRLEAAGLLRRRRNPADERETLVELTEAGAALRVRAAHVPAAIQAATGLDAAALAALRDQMAALRDRLDAG